MIEHQELCNLIPHGGCMCLLSRVLEWDSKTIHCEADNHNDPQNPLRSNNGLSALAAIEYGAQAMAVHGSLLDGGLTIGRKAYLAALREVEFRVDWLHEIKHPLSIRAERLLGDGNGMIYQFSVYALSELLVSGRLTAMLEVQQ